MTTYIVEKILLYLWQLPQNLLGLAVIFFSEAKLGTAAKGVYFTEHNFGVSLGNYIILNEYCGANDIKHERGHQKQSLYLGWLYLLLIGLPSALGNIWDRLFHKAWRYTAREHWYYTLPWEAWADKLGGVKRC